MLELKNKRITVTGGAGFLGGYVIAALEARGVKRENIFVPRREDFDLTTERDVIRLYNEAKPEVVIHLAAEVGGIGANRDHPGRFFFANAAMGLHLIEHARRRGVEKFLQTGTVCAYPKFAPVPFDERDLWNGFPEETNAPYGVAKKSLFVMLDGYYREYGLKSAVVVPVNLYGPHDNFDLQSSHVIPALIRKCVEARDHHDAEVVCWGSGSASREFLYVEDAADAIVTATQQVHNPTPINLGTGQEISIRELVETVARVVGFEGQIVWDTSKPDGQPRRCLNTEKARDLMGWTAKTRFEDGLRKTVAWFETHREHVREVVYG